MAKKFFTIGTATTPKKQHAIKIAREGQLDYSSFDYAKKKWCAALFTSLRIRMNSKLWSDNDVWDFAEEAVDEAFVRVKEYNPKYKFRDFLVQIIIKPKLDKAYKEKTRKSREQITYEEGVPEYQSFEISKLEGDIKPSIEKEIAKDVLRKLKSVDSIKYEVFCLREFSQYEYADIARECKITESNARQIYNRVKKEILPELFSEISNNNKYIDKDLKIKPDILNLIKKEIRKK